MQIKLVATKKKHLAGVLCLCYNNKMCLVPIDDYITCNVIFNVLQIEMYLKAFHFRGSKWVVTHLRLTNSRFCIL